MTIVSSVIVLILFITHHNLRKINKLEEEFYHAHTECLYMCTIYVQNTKRKESKIDRSVHEEEKE